MVIVKGMFDYYNFNWNCLKSDYLFLKNYSSVDKSVGNSLPALIVVFHDIVSAYPATEEKLLPREYFLEEDQWGFSFLIHCGSKSISPRTGTTKAETSFDTALFYNYYVPLLVVFHLSIQALAISNINMFQKR